MNSALLIRLENGVNIGSIHWAPPLPWVCSETLFRGMLFGLLRRDMSWRWAAVASALLLPVFISLINGPTYRKSPGAPATAFRSSSMILPITLTGPYAVNLFLAGLILAGAFQRTGNLFIAIGIHAGWIIALKTNSFISSP